MSFLFGGTPFDGSDRTGRRTPNGGGGGSPPPPSPQQVTTTTSNIPDWLQGPTQSMVARGEALSQLPYQTYGAQRIADFTPAQQEAFSQIYGLQRPGEYNAAGQSLNTAGQATGAAMGAAYGYAPGQFGTAQATQYMSPYQQAVTDIAKREATYEAANLNRQLGSQAAKAGAFGGSRFGVEQALLGSKLATNLSDIQTKGSQAAFENAQQQFERDRQAAAGAAQLRAQTGLGAAGALSTIGSQMANLGTAKQTSDLQRIQALSAAGEQQQAQQQQRLSQAYQDYLERRDWERNQLGYLSGLIRGTPFSTTSTQSTQAPGPSTLSQGLGLGITGLGLAQLLK